MLYIFVYYIVTMSMCLKLSIPKMFEHVVKDDDKMFARLPISGLYTYKIEHILIEDFSILHRCVGETFSSTPIVNR